MLNSADLHESILTPVIFHKHVRYHNGVTLYFSVKFPLVAPKKTRNGYFSYMSEYFCAFWIKNNQKKKKKRKPGLDARKHWESESINCNLSAAVQHIKPSCNNSNSSPYKEQIPAVIISLWQEWSPEQLSFPCDRN